MHKVSLPEYQSLLYTLDALVNCHATKHAFHVPDKLMPLTSTNGILDLTKNFIKQHHSKLSLFANVEPTCRQLIVYVGMILDFVYFE